MEEGTNSGEGRGRGMVWGLFSDLLHTSHTNSEKVVTFPVFVGKSEVVSSGKRGGRG